MRVFLASKHPRNEYACQPVWNRSGDVYKCGCCRKGVVAHDKGGILRRNCLVCGAHITERVMAVRHLDGNIYNNDPSNLRVVTMKENNR